jgi:hypothetical protein
MQYMKAKLVVRTKEVGDDGSVVEVVIWEVPEPLEPCVHFYKYRLFYGTPNQTRVRYDNERGKGDHRHLADKEEHYDFTSIDQLLDDFETDVQSWSAA